jgi:hypothetical protein
MVGHGHIQRSMLESISTTAPQGRRHGIDLEPTRRKTAVGVADIVKSAGDVGKIVWIPLTVWPSRWI